MKSFSKLDKLVARTSSMSTFSLLVINLNLITNKTIQNLCFETTVCLGLSYGNELKSQKIIKKKKFSYNKNH